jgi:beta-lactamase regulating signal transducer with metallopeptidase domain
MTAMLQIGLANALIATLLAIVISGVTRFARQPALVHALWLLVLIKLVTPPLVTIPWHWPSRSPEIAEVSIAAWPIAMETDDPATSSAGEPAMPIGIGSEASLDRPSTIGMVGLADSTHPTGSPIAAGATTTASARDINWVAVVSWLWFVGSAVWLCVAIVRLIRFHRALRNTLPASEEIRQWAEQAAAKLNVTRPFGVRVTEGRIAPLVWPVGRPTILLSRPLVEQLAPEEIRTLLAHELAHLRRKDHWVRWLELVVTILHWWHPVVWWARTMIHRAEEQLCDAWAVWAFPEDVRRYATALFTAVQFTSERRQAVPIVASRLGAGQNLKERIEHIMNATWNRRLSARGIFAMLVAALFILPFSLRAAQPAGDSTAGQGNESKALAAAQPTPARPAQPERAAAPRADNRADLLDTWREQIAFLQERFKEVEALYNSGAERGTREELELAGYELARAKAELSRAEGNADQALANLEKASRHADEALKAVTESYKAGRITSDRLYETAHKMFEARRQLLQARQRQAVKLDSDSERSHAALNAAARPYRISPDDAITVRAIGVSPDAPLDNYFVVESSGTIALGPLYGRVKVSGLTLEEAEQAIREHLLKDYESPRVQVTLMVQQGQVEPAADSSTTLPERRRTVANPLLIVDQVAEAAVPKFDLNRELNQLAPASQSMDSIGVLKTIVAANKRDYDRLKQLYEKGSVSVTEAAAKQSELEIGMGRLRQAERAAQYRRRLIDLAQLELEQALAANKEAPGSVLQSEVRRLEIMVELAKIKYAELAE